MNYPAVTLGIDLGGTGIKLGLVDARGALRKTLRFSTPSKTDPIRVCQMIVAQAQALIRSSSKYKVRAIGIGCAGDVDPAEGSVRISPNLHWRNVPLKALLKRSLKYPIFVENDANAAAWAAYVVEAKRKISNLLCVTLGTGVGGGLVVNHQLYRGRTGSAGEIGHMTLVPNGIMCDCGNRGCLERYVGARAMVGEARRAIEEGNATVVTRLVHNDLSKIAPVILKDAARQKDRLALHLWEQAGERLGIGLASLINVLNPEWIVLAGGLSRAGELLLKPLRRTIVKRSFPAPAAAVKLVISKLDQDLGIVGAGLVAHELSR